MWRNLLKFKGKQVHPKDQLNTWKILKGDTVEVVSGPERGKQGKVIKVMRNKSRVVLEGINLSKRHVKKGMQQEGEKSNYYKAASPIHVSNVMLVDPVTKKPTRVGFKFLENGEKVRVAKKSKAIIPKPKLERDYSFRDTVGPKDTPADVVLKKTFDENTLNPLKIASIYHKETSLVDGKSVTERDLFDSLPAARDYYRIVDKKSLAAEKELVKQIKEGMGALKINE